MKLREEATVATLITLFQVQGPLLKEVPIPTLLVRKSIRSSWCGV